MAHKPRLLTEAELRRFEDCAGENAKLADCWTSDRILVIACKPTSAYKTARVSVRPALELDVLSPAGNPVWQSIPSVSRPTRHFCRRRLRQLERPKGKGDKMYQPRPWCVATGVYQSYELYEEEAKVKAQEVFDELGKGYASVCIATCYISTTMKELGTFGLRLPASTVFVDLIKVLEHQTRECGIPEELKKYTDENVSVWKGRYDGRPGGIIDRHGMQDVRFLELLGPAAEAHRLDFKKAEKEDTALKRIAGRFRNG
ncbi:hypothetical protein CCHL11_04569 [Colletotrichum chlorophyti]|uniref:Uncharacterized protein n=1 Tax=Colletotrichum chlorophyti TaxID=708187 RepID=A0A1Q8RRL6_9PEZI|nr:hypothetical protein CCHL11_04569 [Colletotrichum chlorophyti]